MVLPGANMKMREEVGSEQEARYLAITIKSYIVKVTGGDRYPTQSDSRKPIVEEIGMYWLICLKSQE